VDEDAIRDALLSEGAHPQDIADALAEAKARKVSDRNPHSLVLGCDQVLALEQQLFSKPETAQQARDQLAQLNGKTHHLLSAMVLYDAGQPIWRHVAKARLTMRPMTDAFLDGYVLRNWPSIQDAVGAYKLEEQGAQLFAEIEGDYFTVLGLPLLPLLNYFALRGFLDT
jgi:septum formation protein